MLNNKRGYAEVMAIFVILFYLVIGFGWVMNVVKFTQCDFEPSYKAEVIRAIGLVTPIGGITGYLDLGK